MNPELSLPLSRDAGFVERDRALRSLDHKGVTVFHGQSGTGKTHIALEYAYRCRDEQPVESVLWLSSHGFRRLELSIKSVAKGLLINRSEVDGLVSFIQWYTSRSPPPPHSLLILDDLSFNSFPELEEKALVVFLNNFDPTLGKVLITTSVELPLLKLAGLELPGFQLVSLDCFSNHEAREFLKRRLLEHPWKESETDFFMKSLQNLPLALELAAALWNHCMYPRDKQCLWRKFKAEIANVTASHALEVALRWSVDQTMANNDNTRAFRALCTMSLLEPDGVPLPLIFLTWKNETARHTIAIRRAVRKLTSLSLIRQSNDGQQCFVHGLIQKYVLKYLQQAEVLASYQGGVIKAIRAHFNGEAIFWETAEFIIPHAHQVLAYDEVHGQSKQDRMDLFRALAYYLGRFNKYAESVSLCCNAWDLAKELYGEKDLRTMEVAEQLAHLLHKNDKQDAAADLHRQIEDVYDKCLSPDSYQRLLHRGTYGSVLLEQGKWTEAEARLLDGLEGSRKLYERAVAAPTAGGGPYAATEGPQTLDGANHNAKRQRIDLARLYSQMGHPAKAQSLFDEQLRLARAGGLPETHPFIIGTLHDLGRALVSQGRITDGLAALAQADALAEASTEYLAVELLFLLRDRAAALSGAARTAEAAAVERRVLDVCRRVESPPGWQTRDAHMELGGSLERLGQYAEAREQFETVRRMCGSGESDKQLLLKVRNSLALLHLRLGALDEAEREYMELVQARLELHGGEAAHHQVLRVRNNYAAVLQRQRRYAEALEVQQDVFDKAVPEPDDEKAVWTHTALFAGNNLAESYRLWAEEIDAPDPQGMLKKAEKMHERVLAQREKRLGEVWHTWTSRVNLGMTLQAQERVDEAKACYECLEQLAEEVGEVNATVKMAREKQKLLQVES